MLILTCSTGVRRTLTSVKSSFLDNLYNVHNRRDPKGLFLFGVTMNMYVNLCPAYTNQSETLTVDIPTDEMDSFMQLVHILSEEKNISARRAFTDMVRYTFDNLMEKDYERKSRKNAKRRGRNR